MHRGLVFLAAVLVFGSLEVSAAEGWQLVSDRMAGFSAEFPTEPHISSGDHSTSQSARGKVPQSVYSCDVGGVTYSVMVADFTGLGADPDKVVDEGVSRLAAKGRVNLDFGLEINVVRGREYVVMGDDGTRYTQAFFFHKDRLYQVSVMHPVVHTDPAGSSGINMFLSKFQFLNPF